MVNPHDIPKPLARIPGSAYFRAYCARCGEPMRVSSDCPGLQWWCERCSPGLPPGRHTGLTQRQREGLPKTSG